MPATFQHPRGGETKAAPSNALADTPHQTGLATPASNTPAALSHPVKPRSQDGAVNSDTTQPVQVCPWQHTQGMSSTSPANGVDSGRHTSTSSGGARYLPIIQLAVEGANQDLVVQLPPGARKPRSTRPLRAATSAAHSGGAAGAAALAMALEMHPEQVASSAASLAAAAADEDPTTVHGRVLKRPFWMSSCATAQEQQSYLVKQQRRSTATAAAAAPPQRQPPPQQKARQTAKQAGTRHSNVSGYRSGGLPAAAGVGRQQPRSTKEEQEVSDEDEDAAAALLALLSVPPAGKQLPEDRAGHLEGTGRGAKDRAGIGKKQQQLEQQQAGANQAKGAVATGSTATASLTATQELRGNAIALGAADGTAPYGSKHSSGLAKSGSKGGSQNQQQVTTQQQQQQQQQQAALRKALQIQQQQQQVQALNWLAQAGLLRSQSGRLDAMSSGLWLQWQAVLHCYSTGQVGAAMQLAHQLGAATATCLRGSQGDGRQVAQTLAAAVSRTQVLP